MEAIIKGKPLSIEISFDNHRPLAELMKFEAGWVFADIGWAEPTNPSHPFHLIKGELEGEGPWTIGKYEITVMEDANPGLIFWKEWQKIKGSLGATRPRAARAAKASLGLK